jgi:DNA-binding NarL/FixJ family response regulator
MVVTDPIRILCVEDHPVYREGLKAIIGSEPNMLLVGHAANAAQATAEFRRLRPDVTLMDFRLPGANGVDVLIAIRGEFPQARVIMLTTSDGDADIQRAMRAGASAYILKSMPMEELLGVIRSVHSGRRHIPPEVAAKLAEFMGDEDLTARELDVLRLIREGYRNKQIADQLTISENTVNFHIKNLMEKASRERPDACRHNRPAARFASNLNGKLPTKIGRFSTDGLGIVRTRQLQLRWLEGYG